MAASQPDAQASRLSILERLLGFLLAGALFVGAGYLHFLPSKKIEVQVELEDGTYGTQTTDSMRSSVVTVGVAAAGAALLLFSLNGRRIDRFSLPKGMGVSFSETAAAAKEFESKFGASEQLSRDLDHDEKTSESSATSGSETTKASTKEVATIEVRGKELKVYDLSDVPVWAVYELTRDWKGDDRSRPLGEFEFAARLPGDGNHPWYFKPKGYDSLWRVRRSTNGSSEKDAVEQISLASA